MTAIPLLTTRIAAAAPIRHQGVLLIENYAQFTSMFERGLSPAHARFLAEPTVQPLADSILWQTSYHGGPPDAPPLVVPVVSLSGQELEAALRKTVDLWNDIAAMARELMLQTQAARRLRGQLVALALHVPSAQNIFMVAEQPVAACWGCCEGALLPAPEEVLDKGCILLPMLALPSPPPLAPPPPDAPLPPPPAAGAQKRRWPRLLFAFFLGLLFAAGALILIGLLLDPGHKDPVYGLTGRQGCSVKGPADKDGGRSEPQREIAPPAPEEPPAAKAPPPTEPEAQAPPPASENTPPAGDSAEALTQSLQQAQEEERRLRSAIGVLRHNLISRMALCERSPKAGPPETQRPPEQPPAAKSEPEPEQPAPSLSEFMPTSPEPAPEPKKPSTPKKPPEQKQTPKGAELRIPPKAAENNDLRFLEGCWSYVAGTTTLTLKQTDGETEGEYCFDAKGVGYRNIRKLRNNDRCKGPARASFDANGNLVLHTERSYCSKEPERYYTKDRKVCTPGPDGKAPCSARDEYGTRWNVTLK
ncbi:hypothetical protein LJC59_06505, partial [Desulfovibrio sp. OttesenSCG-928-A18]|nr:hypothetical protein [Desulfovibrio sp. OttesenSCG-928-A18]